MKSHESDQASLAICIYKDAVAKCVAVQSSLRDIKTLTSRVKDEGLSFLTITLPIFGKDFERSLADGQIDPTAFRGFRKSGAIPAFLQGMLGRVFNRITGRILSDEAIDISCIEGIRQVAYAFKKLEMDCTPKRVLSAMDSFAETEHVLTTAKVTGEALDDFVQVSNILWSGLKDINVFDLIPRHGPGATVEGVSGNQKFQWQCWHERLEPYFPFLGTAHLVSSYGEKEFEDVTFVSSEMELPVKVTPVPKTLKGPRVIAIEPCCMQYAQQAVRRELYARIERMRFSAGHVNFTDQSINRNLAMMSSKDGRLATIDLSDASDRVLFDLAIRMFDCNPDLQDAIVACRSTRAKLPDGRIIGPLAKFASMGSALCFPVESMYFYTICVAALLREQNLPVTSRNCFIVSRDVYVYGDDIIIPSRWATSVVDHLQKYYCKVNMLKSYWNGKFRESCGMDAYDGVEVTPTYIRHGHPSSRRQASELVSWVKTANLFAKKGYYLTSSYMFNVCERYLGKLPEVSETSPALGRISSHPIASLRYNRLIQAYEIRAWVASPIYRTDELGGYGALMKSLLNLRNRRESKNYILDPIEVVDSKNLERSARHGAVALKRRWVSAY